MGHGLGVILSHLRLATSSGEPVPRGRSHRTQGSLERSSGMPVFQDIADQPVSGRWKQRRVPGEMVRQEAKLFMRGEVGRLQPVGDRA